MELCIKANIDFDADGDKARLFLGDDIVVELEGQSSPYVRIYEDGTKQYEEAGSAWSDLMQVEAIYSAEKGLITVKIYDTLATPDCHLLAASDTWTGYSVGLGTGDTNASGITFDDFEFLKAESTTNPDCISTCIDCPNGCVVQTVPIEISGFPSTGTGVPDSCDCSVLNGLVLYLTQGGYDSSTRDWEPDKQCAWGTEVEFVCGRGNPDKLLKIEAVWTYSPSYYYWVINGYIEDASSGALQGTLSGGYTGTGAFACDDANLTGDFNQSPSLACLEPLGGGALGSFEINP
jgi:hypothetical protein